MLRRAPYQPFYCEENVWQLAREAQARGVHPAYAVFVSNADRTVAMWAQRAGSPVVWDYHVVLGVDSDDGMRVWDFDSKVGFDVPLRDWLAASFPHAGTIAPSLAPQFRLVDVPTFLAEFRTDRRHMLDHGEWRHPPPPWPPLATTSNLWDYVDPAGKAPGVVLSLDELRQLDRFEDAAAGM